MLARTIRLQRRVAWLGLVAILLLSIVPTISQFITSRAIHSGHTSASTHDADQSRAQHDHSGGPGVPCPDGGKHGDEWHKCGYCDFLAHTPALGHLVYSALLSAALPPVLVSRATVQRTRPSHFPAAPPRGPPSFLA